MWVATKWDFFFFFFFFLGGGGHVWATLRLRLRLGIVSEVGVYSNLNVFGPYLIHIF